MPTGAGRRRLATRTNRLYADDMGKDTVFTVDLGSDEPQTLTATDSHPNSMALDPSGRVLYVSNRGQNGSSYYVPGPEWGSVIAVDATSGRMLDAIVGGNQTTGLDVSPDGRWLAFTDFLDNKVQVFAVPPIDALLAGSGGRASLYKAELRKPVAARTKTTGKRTTGTD